MMPSSQFDFSQSQFSSSQNAAAYSTTPFKMRSASSTMPLTIKQIADALQFSTGEKGAPFVVDGVEAANIRLVGMVTGKVDRPNDVPFTLDDGTGRLDFMKWVNDAADSAEIDAIQNGMYVSVVGSLKFFQERKRATAFSIRPIVDFDEVTLHFVECIRMHMENTKLKMSPLSLSCTKVGSPARTGTSMGVSVSNGLSESSTPTSLKSNPAAVTSGTSGSNETDLNTQVLNIFLEPANFESEHGVHIDEIIKRFRLPEEKIREAIEYNMDAGHIYSTIDDFHYKSAMAD